MSKELSFGRIVSSPESLDGSIVQLEIPNFGEDRDKLRYLVVEQETLDQLCISGITSFIRGNLPRTRSAYLVTENIAGDVSTVLTEPVLTLNNVLVDTTGKPDRPLAGLDMILDYYSCREFLAFRKWRRLHYGQDSWTVAGREPLPSIGDVDGIQEFQKVIKAMDGIQYSYPVQTVK